MLHRIIQTQHLSIFSIWSEYDVRWMQSSVIHKLFLDNGNKFRAIISTFLLDEVEFINTLKDDFAVEIREILDGRMDYIGNGVDFINLENCKIKQKWFGQLGAQSPTDIQIVSFYWYVVGSYHIQYKQGEQ